MPCNRRKAALRSASDAVAAPAGIVLVIDDAPEAMIAARQGVTVLRGPRAEDLVHGWRSAVAA